MQGLEGIDDHGLFQQLGLRIKALERDPTIAGYFTPPAGAVQPMGVTLADLRDLGRRMFARLSRSGYSMVCGEEESMGGPLERLLSTLNTNVTTVSAALAAVLVSQLAIAPAIAGVVAALAIGKVAPSTLEGICRTWGDRAGFAGPSATSPDAQPQVPAPNPGPDVQEQAPQPAARPASMD